MEAAIQREGIEVFVPTTSVVRQWRDRRVRIEQPLFAGYAFVRTDGAIQAFSRVLRLPNVVRFIGSSIAPAIVPSAEIEAIKLLGKHRIPCEPAAFPAVGDAVILHGGCLEGIHGVLTRVAKRDQVVISVSAIQRALTVHLGQEYQIERCTRPAPAGIIVASQCLQTA